ncbi:MAG: guanylate kinase [Pseudomonadota bacterium]
MERSEKVHRARYFRRRPPRSEALLGEATRGWALSVKFYRQKPMLGFIPDFVCESHWVIIEVDGRVHEQ